MKRIPAFLISVVLGLSEALAAGRKDEAYLIRRAYIDVLGVTPTVAELEWYCVYNEDSYSKAVAWLLEHNATQNIDRQKLRSKLLSDEYKTKGKEALPEKLLQDVIYYVAGADKQALTLREAKLKAILNARTEAVADLDAFDFLALQFMGRVTSADEANKLLKILRQAPSGFSENDIWLLAFDCLLSFYDVTHK